MAIQFARIEILNRKNGGNACCKGTYNARSKITDEKIGKIFNFTKHSANVYHKILLPCHVDKSVDDLEVLMNAIEHIERKRNN